MMETAERYGGSEKEKIGEVNELVSIHRDGALIDWCRVYVRCLDISRGYNMTRLYFPAFE